MITDKLSNMPLYYKAFPFLEKVNEVSEDIKAGKYQDSHIDIDGENMYASVSSYETKSPDGALYESHKKYIDVQVLLKGSETIGWAPLCDCRVTKDFEPGGDIAFYESDRGSPVTLHADYFMLMLPGDAHEPCLNPGKTESVTKIVFKVRIGS